MSEREEAIERLQMLEFTDEMDSHMMLSMIGRAVWPGAVAWTPLTCRLMRDELMDLLDYTDAEIDGVRQECSEMLDRMAKDAMPLPLDVNGSVVHVGDEVCHKNVRPIFGFTVVWPVSSLIYKPSGWYAEYVAQETGKTYTVKCKDIRVVRKEQS